MRYEYRHPHFKIATPKDPLCPSHWFGWYDWALIQDHATQTTQLVILDEANVPIDLGDRLAQAHRSEGATYACGPFRHDVSYSRYVKDVGIIADAINAGDCYQVNYAQRFSAPFQGSTAQAYLSLRRATPNPYCAYLALPSGETLLSLSQERFIQISGDSATTEPIKGTIERGNTADSDSLNQQVLQASEKNRAENLMIVDLLRNDFSQNCKPHSIQVPELFALKSYSNVHHLVSTVTGTLKDGVSHCQFLLDCFPGGLITGAPKKRAMEMIQSLEPFSRGPYCGAIGYWSANGETEFNISIRTLLHAGQQLYCWGGGGIVADSVAEEEYQESVQKVAVLMNAVAPVCKGISP